MQNRNGPLCFSGIEVVVHFACFWHKQEWDGAQSSTKKAILCRGVLYLPVNLSTCTAQRISFSKHANPSGTESGKMIQLLWLPIQESGHGHPKRSAESLVWGPNPSPFPLFIFCSHFFYSGLTYL